MAKKKLLKGKDIEVIELFLQGLQHEIDKLNNDPDFVKEFGPTMIDHIVTPDEFIEQHKAGNEMWGAEDAPGPLTNVRGAGKEVESHANRQKMVEQIQNTKVWKEKFDGESPNAIIPKYTKTTFQGHRIDDSA